MADLQVKPIPNLIQGVSQQAAQQRRDSQCEEQFDCINSPEDGAVSRNGAELARWFPGLDLTQCFTYEVFRGTDHYLYTIKGGVLRVFNLGTGASGVVTLVGTAAAYLVNDTPYPDAYAYRVQTVDDFTFIAKRGSKPLMLGDTTPTRPHEALLFFRAGAYSCSYAINVFLAEGGSLNYTYYTPDNSTAANTPYIDTNQIAATFYRAMTGSPAAGSSYNGDTGTVGSVYVGAGRLPPHGFSVAIDGNLIRVWRNDGLDFGITVSDGQGGGGIEVFKDTVSSVNNLPKAGFVGMTFGVKGSTGSVVTDGSANSDFYVQYQGGSDTTGSWGESTRPGTPVSLNPATMPHSIVNTDTDTFTVQPNVWGGRLCGDGTLSSKDPGFVGKGIEDLAYDKQRLVIITQSTVDFSKALNPFDFFLSTLQAVLAADPIGIRLAGSDAVALLQRKLQIDEGLFIWAQRAQFRVSQGQNALFAQDTVQAPQTTAYEFSPNAVFAKVASSMYFATETGDFTAIRNLVFQNGRSLGDTDVTSHVPAYIPAPVSQLEVSDTGQLMFVRSDATPLLLYLYDYLVEGQNIVQSSWNTWRMPDGVAVLWCGVRQDILNIFHQRADGVGFLQVQLSANKVDNLAAGDKYRTRLDYRVAESQCDNIAYDGQTHTSTVRLPVVFTQDELPFLRVATRANGALVRGRLFDPVSLAPDGRTLTVQGDLTSNLFYAGLVVSSERLESEFFIRSEDGVNPVDRLQVREFRISVDRTGYSRLEADIGEDRVKVQEFQPLRIGASVIGQPPAIGRGKFDIRVDANAEDASIRIINDSVLPSRWQTAAWHYQATSRAKVPGRRPSA